MKLPSPKQIVYFVCLFLPVSFAENILFGWLQNKMGIANEDVGRALQWTLDFGLPALTVGIGFVLYYFAINHWGANTSVAKVDGRGGVIWSLYWPFGYIPISKAAQISYQQTQGKYDTHWLEAISYLREETEEQMRDKFAKYLGMTSAQLFGVRPLMDKFEVIHRGTFQNPDTEFRNGDLYDFGAQVPRYTKVCIKRSDLRKAIAELNAVPEEAVAAPPAPSTDDFILVKDAIVYVNDGLHGTDNAQLLLKWMDGESKKEGIEIAGTILANNIQLYGARPYKTILEPIDVGTVEFKMATWSDDATTLRKRNSKEILYSNPCFKKRDLDAFIASHLGTMREESSNATIATEFIPLVEAARMIYEKARHRNHLLARAAERLSGNKTGQIGDGTPEDILDFIATHIGRKAQIYGARPPSDRIELIAAPEVAISTFESGALILKNDRHVYTSLEVQKRDLYQLILGLEANGA